MSENPPPRRPFADLPGTAAPVLIGVGPAPVTLRPDADAPSAGRGPRVGRAYGPPNRRPAAAQSAAPVRCAAHPRLDVDAAARVARRAGPVRAGRAAPVNGLGATPLIELYALFDEVGTRFAVRGATIARSPVRDHVTDLDTAGASITAGRADERQLARWDAPVGTAAPRWGT